MIQFENRLDGGADRNRTDDLLHAMQALYQLSYGPQNTRIVPVFVRRICHSHNPYASGISWLYILYSFSICFMPFR